MEFFEKLFGVRLWMFIGLLIVGLLMLFFPVKELISGIVGFFMTLIAIGGIILEARLIYFIKVKQSKKSFKSKNESFIAKYFDKKKIKYLYEQQLKLGDQIVRPDFFLPEFDVYVEYWGKWGADFEYRKECNHKRQLYEKYNYNLVELYPDNLRSIHQLDWKFTERLLKILKKDRS
jgi:hypothetical protein